MQLETLKLMTGERSSDGPCFDGCDCRDLIYQFYYACTILRSEM
jgi:hypothetical protein